MKKLYEVCKKLIEDGIDIILAGLDMDYKGEPFGSMPKLLAISHDVKMHAVCFDCGETANYTFRINNDTQQVLIGSEEKNYKALCKNCFLNKIK